MNLAWLVIIINTAWVGAMSCPAGQKQLGNSCYRLLNKTMTWEGATRACSDMGGGLAVPDSSEEHQFIWKMFTGSVQEGNVWTGCTDKEEEGKYVHSGQQCHYLEWAPGEPYDGENQDCIVLWRKHQGLMDDDGCNLSCFVICESPAVLFESPVMFCMQANPEGRFVGLRPLA